MSDYTTADPELLTAAQRGDIGQVQTLVEQWRAKLSPLTASHLRQPLVESLVANQARVVSYLLGQGAELDSHIVTLASVEETSTDMFQVFLDHGWDINSITSNGAPRLKYVRLSQLGIKGKFLTLTFSRDVVPFESLVRFFLANGANPNSCGPRRFSILDVAAASSTPEVFNLLLQHGANLDDSTALHAAAAGAGETTSGRIEMMAFLLDTVKMDINAIAKHGPPAGRGLGRGTPLHSAAFVQKRETIEFLLARNADVDARNTLGQTALEFAGEWGLDESAETLREHTSSR